MQLQGKGALVTAGSAGLGAAIARALVREGMSVAINYSNNAERANALLNELESLKHDGATVVAIRADMAKRDEIIRLVAEAQKACGPLAVVASNHGWTSFTNFTNLDENVNEDDWDHAFMMNVKSHVWLLHAVREDMRQQGNGSFVMTSSVAGTTASGSSLFYSATKGCQLHMMKGLAKSVAPEIRVNAISPGVLLTDWGMRFGEERLRELKEKTLLKHFAELDDIAQLVVTISKTEASTAQNFVVDAGATAA